MFDEKRGKMVRIAPELVRRIEEYRRQQNKEEYRPLKFTEASRKFAETAITPKDALAKGLNIIGKKWTWRK